MSGSMSLLPQRTGPAASMRGQKQAPTAAAHVVGLLGDVRPTDTTRQRRQPWSLGLLSTAVRALHQPGSWWCHRNTTCFLYPVAAAGKGGGDICSGHALHVRAQSRRYVCLPTAGKHVSSYPQSATNLAEFLGRCQAGAGELAWGFNSSEY